ncbi:hypothetical protein D3C72_1010850 [compost metagenome]
MGLGPTQAAEHGNQGVATLAFIGAAEGQDVGRPATDRGVEGVQSIGAHDDSGGELISREAIDAPNEGVHAGLVLMVHLGRFPRLREGVGLIHQHQYRAPGAAV